MPTTSWAEERIKSCITQMLENGKLNLEDLLISISSTPMGLNWELKLNEAGFLVSAVFQRTFTKKEIFVSSSLMKFHATGEINGVGETLQHVHFSTHIVCPTCGK